MWPFLKFCKLVEKFISSVPCGAKYWCKKVVVNKVMVQMGIPSTKSKTKCKLTELSMTGKKIKWGDYLTHINMYWQGFGLGTTREQIQALFRMGLGCQILSICQQFHQFSHQPYLGNFPFFFWSHKE